MIPLAVAWPFLAALIFWLGILFVGFGVLARFELGSPYSGLIQLSDQPLRLVLAQLTSIGL